MVSWIEIGIFALMKIFKNDSTDPHYNMALDEWMLACMDCEEPVLRIWRNSPSVIVGANQNVFSEVNLDYLDKAGIVLARRGTGGGAVYHDLQNVNYSFAGPVSVIGDGTSCVETIAAAIRQLGAPCEVSGRNDLTVEGRKVSGFARRNQRNRVLVHGTLMYDVDFEALTLALSVPGSKLEAKGISSVRSRVANLSGWIPGGVDLFMDSLVRIMSDPGGEVLTLSREDEAVVSGICGQRYASWEWIYGRSREADFVREAVLPCGKVSARLKIDGGVIVSCMFEGDFLGLRPSAELSGRLRGLKYSSETILPVLHDVPDFFQNTGAEDLLHLLI